MVIIIGELLGKVSVKLNVTFLNFIFPKNINLISCLYSNLLNKILFIEVAGTLFCTLLYIYVIILIRKFIKKRNLTLITNN